MAPQENPKLSYSRRWELYQPSKTLLAWACIATAIATIFVGFTFGGWVTGGAAREAAVSAGNSAQSELASAICVERFKAAPDSATRLVELNALSGIYNRRQFIETNGWATMPGQTSPNRNAAETCAAALGA